MRVLLIIATGVSVFLALTISPVLFALVLACVMLLGADVYMRFSERRRRHLEIRLERWCNPTTPLPETRGDARPRLAISADHLTPGRAAGGGRRPSVLELGPLNDELSRGPRRGRTELSKHPGQDSNLQPAD